MLGADRLKVVEGAITRQAVEAIVNAANTTLLGGGGVDGAIRRKTIAELIRQPISSADPCAGRAVRVRR